MSPSGGPKGEYRSAQHEGAAVSSAVASPCVNVCQMDEASGWCQGCLRTIDEIAFWSVLDDDDKRAVLAALPPRQALRAEQQQHKPQQQQQQKWQPRSA